MMPKKVIEKTSGMSKRDDPRSHCPAPVPSAKSEMTLQKVGKRGGKGGPYMDARRVQPKAAQDGPFEVTMAGRGKKK